MTDNTKSKTQSFRLIKYVLFLVFINITIALLYVVWKAEFSYIQNRTMDENRYIASVFNGNIQSRILALERMASRWVVRKGTPRKEWEEDATHYVADLIGFQAIEWIDTTYHVRWIIPFEGNESAQDLFIKFEEKRAKAVQNAIDTDEVLVTESIDLVQGGKGFLSYFPLIYEDGSFNGILVGVFRIPELLQSIIKLHQIHDFHIQVYEDSNLIFESENIEFFEHEKWVQKIPIRFYGAEWVIHSWPTKKYITDNSSITPYVILMVGIILSILSIVIINLLEQKLQYSSDLQKSKNQLQHIFDTAVDGMLTFDESATVLSFNPSCESIFGYKQADIIGEPIFTLLPHHLRDQFQYFIHQYLKTGEAEYVGKKREVQGLRSNGETFMMEISVSEAGHHNPRLFSVVVRDISRRKRIEDEREKLIQRLKISNENLEQFARAASHDLKEPVRSVSNYLELFDKKFGDQLEEKAKRYITLSIQSAKRMNALIEGLLEYSMIDIRNMEFTTVNLNLTINAIQSNLDSLIHANQATIIADNLPTIRAVDFHMLQLFQNLVINGIKYRGTESPRVVIKVEKQENTWLFSVQDNGMGIESTYKEKIFQLFKRLHTQSEVSGSGIGLALCKRIVGRHGGDIWVESTPGQGSTFYFTLPSKTTSI